jgi:hypothetical protein
MVCKWFGTHGEFVNSVYTNPTVNFLIPVEGYSQMECAKLIFTMKLFSLNMLGGCDGLV